MPEPAAATLEAAIDAALEARRAKIEELVAAAVDARLVALVDQELDAAIARLEHPTNGATPAPELGNGVAQSVHASSSPATPATSTPALCGDCHERPPLAGRRVCGRCKAVREQPRRRGRERRETTAVDVQGDPSDAPGRPADAEPAPAVDDHQAADSAAAPPLDPAGLTAEVLVRRTRRTGVANTLGPVGLQRWLLAERLATVDEHGRLQPTPLTHAIAGALGTSA